MEFKNIFQPIKIRNLELKNRIIYPAIATKMVDEDGYIEDNLIDYHLMRVRGGSSLNILESTSVHEATAAKHFPKISDDKYIEKLKELVDRVHSEGGRMGIQLWQGGLYDMENPDREIISPSKYTSPGSREIEAVSPEKIEEIVLSFVEGARRALEAGFDLIELNISHNECLHNFLSKAYNKRRDDYGGSLENRCKIIVDIIESIRREVSEEVAIVARIVGKDDLVKDGLTSKEVAAAINILADAGLDAVSIVRGNITTDARVYEVAPIEIEEGFNLDLTGEIREKVKLPLIASGRIIDPEMIDGIIGRGLADMVAVGRAMIADSAFVRKVEENRTDDIVKCIACNEGCFDSFGDILYKHITCLRNPSIGREGDFKIVETSEPKKIGVVGGGVGGIYASILLKKKGHQVILYEKEDRLGGQFRFAKLSPRRKEIKEMITDLIRESEELAIDTRLNTAFKTDYIRKEKFDIVIIATGSESKGLTIKTQANNIVKGFDILSEKLEVSGNIVILGAGLLGLELAEILGGDNTVTVLEKTDKIGKDTGELRKILVLKELEELGVTIKRNIEIKEILKDRVVYIENSKQKEVKANYVVLSLGAESNKSNDIKQYCQDREIPFFVLGDALIPRKALDAILEAANIAMFEID